MIDKMIDKAVVEGEPSLKIIHGHGTGSLKRSIREHLKHFSCVKKICGADPQSGGDAITQVIPVNGILQKIIIASGAATGISGTLTLAIKDNGGNTIFPATAGPAETEESTFNVWEPIAGTMSAIVDPSDDPTSGTWEIVVTLRGIK